MARIWNKHKQTNTPLKRKVFVAMSGGVDSSVAAYLLQKQGYDVTGVFMKCFNLDGCAVKDAEDARRVASHLNIPFYVFDFEKEYKKQVVKYMIDGYKKGITPNPDVVCNKEIKFGLFLKKALEMGADHIATGHYVKIKSQISNLKNSNQKSKKKKLEIGNWKLEIAQDKQKDQSYFLWTLKQNQLKYCLFPIGDYLKSEVREIAKKAGLATAEKKDSQGICFLGKVTLSDFLKKYIKPKKGDIIDINGKKIGEHDGTYFYTIGQRHIGVNYKLPVTKYQKKNREPYYVVAKNIKKNILIVAEGESNKALCKKEIKLANINLINKKTFQILNTKYKIPVFVRIRYRQPLASATLYKIQSANWRTKYKILFKKPRKFVAPGQSAVIYSKNGELLGGGVIIESK